MALDTLFSLSPLRTIKVGTVYVSSQRFVSQGKYTQLRMNLREVGGESRLMRPKPGEKKPQLSRGPGDTGLLETTGSTAGQKQRPPFLALPCLPRSVRDEEPTDRTKGSGEGRTREDGAG